MSNPLFVSLAAFTYMGLLCLGGCRSKSANSDQRSSNEASMPLIYHGKTIDTEALTITVPEPWHFSGRFASGQLAVVSERGEKGMVGTLEFGSDKSRSFTATKWFEKEAWNRGLIFDVNESTDGKTVFFRRDQSNDERFNIFRFDLESGENECLTDSAYVGGFVLSPDQTKIAYASRREPGETSVVDVRLKDMVTGEDRVLFSDENLPVKMPWSSMAFSPDGKTLFLTGYFGTDRMQGNIIAFKVDGSESPKTLLPPSNSRLFPKLVSSSLWQDDLFYTSAETGVSSVMAVNTATGKLRKVFGLDGAKVNGMAISKTKAGKDTLTVVTESIRGGRVIEFDLETNSWQVVSELPYAYLRLLDVSPEQILVGGSSAFEPAAALVVDRLNGRYTVAVALSESERESSLHCDVREVMVPTFDDLHMVIDGEESVGKLFARYYTPRHSDPKLPPIAVVQAFYGGSNLFDREMQAFCAAGISILSPAVRGEADVGPGFEQINDGDLGGKEILDGQYAARWLVENQGFAPEMVGAWGHSHGGYATMRQMTFPRVSAGLERQFAWGFGIAKSGFASVRGQYDLSNIKGWIAKEAGGSPENPADLARWEERSPVNHVDALNSPILLVHGTADRRVPLVLSQILVDKAQELGKSSLVELAPIEGAGHAYTSGEDFIKALRAELHFLERRVPRAK